jgi:hypothetical protein
MAPGSGLDPWADSLQSESMTGTSVESRPLGVRLVLCAGAVAGGWILFGIGLSLFAGVRGSLVALPAAAFAVFGVVRGWRISLVADQESVRIRNLFRTYDIQWSDIGSVAIGTGNAGGAPLPAVVVRKARDGAHVAAQATTSGQHERLRVLRALEQLAPASVAFDSRE